MNEEERGVTGMAVEDQLYQELVEKIKTYHPAKDFDMLEKAYNLAREAHKDQKRKSGEPYIIHPLKVAYILAELELDMESLRGFSMTLLRIRLIPMKIFHVFSVRKSPFWLTVLQNWVSCLTPQKKKFRQKTIVRCFWQWQRISVLF